MSQFDDMARRVREDWPYQPPEVVRPEADRYLVALADLCAAVELARSVLDDVATALPTTQEAPNA